MSAHSQQIMLTYSTESNENTVITAARKISTPILLNEGQRTQLSLSPGLPRKEWTSWSTRSCWTTGEWTDQGHVTLKYFIFVT